MIPIEMFRLLLTIILTVGGGLIFLLLRHRMDVFQHLHMKPKNEFLVITEEARQAYQKKRTARRSDLESRTRTEEEEEELLIMCGEDAHDNALNQHLVPEMISIVSPLMKAKDDEYHASMVKKLGENCPRMSAPCLTRTPNVRRWELSARPFAAAEIGALFCYLTVTNVFDDTQAVSYLLLRADVPERWKHFEMTHGVEEDLTSVLSTHTGNTYGELIMPPSGPIVEFVWKPISKVWARSL